MIFKELLQQTLFSDIEEAMLKHYPDQDENIDDYKRVYFKLLNIKPKELDYKMKIYVSYVKDFFEKEDGTYDYYWDVCGIDPDDVDGPHYGIEFNEWADWLSFEIDEDNLKNMTKAEIAAHALWEMTFCGFEESGIQEEIQELQRRVEEIESGLVQTKSWDELKAELGWEDEDLEIEVGKGNKLNTYMIEKKEDDENVSGQNMEEKE